MGYHSTVRAVIHGPSNVILGGLTAWRMSCGHSASAITEVFDMIAVVVADEHNAVIALNGNDWKWYPSYEDVHAFEDLFSYFQGKEDEGVIGAFVRIGEESGDVEERYFGDDPYNLVRPIQYVESEYEDEGEKFRGNFLSSDFDLKSTLTLSTKDDK